MAPTILGDSKSHQLSDTDKALRAAISKLPNPLPKRIEEICSQLHMQLWQFIAGHLLKADQRAELHAPLLLPEWSEKSQAPPLDGAKVCPSCHQQFTPPDDRPDAVYCCNFCGSGRFVVDQLHHERCQFYIKPQQTVRLTNRYDANLPPPTDPQERLMFERAAMARHLEEARAAEAAPGGLTPIPRPDEGITTKELWRPGA